MSWLKKSKSNPMMVVVAVLMAVVVFALPQGICLKTMLSDGQCCSSSRIFADMPVSDYVKPCCKAHAPKTASQEHSRPTSEDTRCIWTSTAPYLLANFDHSEIVVVNLATLPWEFTFGAEIPAPVSPTDVATKELISPALRRGSSILRI